jgi:hypothetical protein
MADVQPAASTTAASASDGSDAVLAQLQRKVGDAEEAERLAREALTEARAELVRLKTAHGDGSHVVKEQQQLVREALAYSNATTQR